MYMNIRVERLTECAGASGAEALGHSAKSGSTWHSRSEVSKEQCSVRVWLCATETCTRILSYMSDRCRMRALHYWARNCTALHYTTLYSTLWFARNWMCAVQRIGHAAIDSPRRGLAVLPPAPLPVGPFSSLSSLTTSNPQFSQCSALIHSSLMRPALILTATCPNCIPSLPVLY